MKRPRLARLATDLLANEPVAERAPSIDTEARTVEAIAGAIRARARRQRQIRLASGLALAAAVLLAVGYSARTRASDPPNPAAVTSAPHAPAETLASAHVVDVGAGAVVVRKSARLPLDPSARLEAGDRLIGAARSFLTFKLADASQVIVDPDSEVTVASLTTTRRFHLSRGALRADVTKLAPGERFVVETSDVEVEVHGTSFRVALAADTESPPSCAQTRTRVSVLEGVVAVRWHGAEEAVSAGTTWPPPCAEQPNGRTASVPRPGGPVPSSALVQHPSGPAPSPSLAPAPPPVVTAPPAPAGTAQGSSRALAEQNQLFAEATTARRNGHAAAAVAAYERLLSRYPDSVLAENATVERMRALDTIDPGRARAAAADYLARYPKGYARAEAERLAGR